MLRQKKKVLRENYRYGKSARKIQETYNRNPRRKPKQWNRTRNKNYDPRKSPEIKAF